MLGQVVHQSSSSIRPLKCLVRLFINNPSSIILLKCSVRLFINNPSSIILPPSDDQFTISSFQYYTRSSHPALLPNRPFSHCHLLCCWHQPPSFTLYAYHVFIPCRFATPSICQHAQPMDRGRGAGGRAVGDVVAQSGLVDAVCGTSPEVTWQRDRDVRSS